MDKKNRLHALIRAIICVLFTAGPALWHVQPAYAATYTVNSLADTNDGTCGGSDCTLREAILSANATAAADTILFSLSGTITLNSVLPGIQSTGGNLTIDGSGWTIHLNGNDHDRVFWTNTNARLTLKHLIIEEGYTTVSGGGVYNYGTLTVDDCTFNDNAAEDYGGAIYSQGTLTIQNSYISYNYTEIGSGGAIYVYTDTVATISQSDFYFNGAEIHGGAIYNFGAVEINDSSFILNSANNGSGGAIYNLNELVIQNVTFGANFASLDGGALYHKNISSIFQIDNSAFNHNLSYRDGGGIYNYGILDVEHSTFFNNEASRNGGAIFHSYQVVHLDNSTLSSNSADKGGGVYSPTIFYMFHCTVAGNSADTSGGGIYGEYITLHSSIVANSTSGGNCGSDGDHPDNVGNNIDSGTTCGWGSANGSMSNTNPKLGTLQDNGGKTKTMALLAGSPAIDGVTFEPEYNCLSEDQRDYPRPYGVRCDIGAFERYYRLFLPVVKHH